MSPCLGNGRLKHQVDINLVFFSLSRHEWLKVEDMSRVESYFASREECPNNEIGPLEFFVAESPVSCNTVDWFRAGLVAAEWLQRPIARWAATGFHPSTPDVPHDVDISHLSVADLLNVRTIDAGAGRDG